MGMVTFGTGGDGATLAAVDDKVPLNSQDKGTPHSRDHRDKASATVTVSA